MDLKNFDEYCDQSKFNGKTGISEKGYVEETGPEGIQDYFQQMGPEEKNIKKNKRENDPLYHIIRSIVKKYIKWILLLIYVIISGISLNIYFLYSIIKSLIK